ncbi:ASCH domain-containing protein [Peribacillus asahii]|uniref:ASCH domain-containing protein n=1 Tax=Peribacillus asahii TaxID=228899 RepID=UPI00207A5710|nr:ASCH domain-containing protein [Peribacillus asahii]USK71725.1 ASCH domain-containing protein [Peribacillus asahii]
MCNILLSIHPQFVEKIFNGEKRYEFRKIKTKRNPKKILIYSTSPISRVVGEADIENILIDTPDKIWEKTSFYSGIDEKFFQKYYKNKEQAVAYQLKNIVVYNKPKKLKEFGLHTAPQSFVYVQ